MLATLNSIYQLRSHRLLGFRPRVRFEIKFGNFILKTAENTNELREALELRFQVFHRELNGRQRSFGLDVDPYDSHSDHLIVRDLRGHRVVGALRLNSSALSPKLFTSDEFILTRILAKPGSKVEVGRLCLHQDYRSGLVDSLLWRGVQNYMIQTRSRWLLTLGTVKTAEPRAAALVYRYFYDLGLVRSEFFAPPTLKCTLPQLNFWLPKWREALTVQERHEAEQLISPTLRSVISRGAYVGGEPALDPQFQCIDFLTIMDREKNSFQNEFPEQMPELG